MIRWTMLKAGMVGISVLILGDVLYFLVLIEVRSYELLRLGLFSFPSIAAFATAYFAPRWKIFMGTSMAAYGAALAIVSSAIYESLGFYIDHIGGLFATFIIILGYHVAFCVVGSLAGYYFANQRKARSKSNGSASQ